MDMMVIIAWLMGLSMFAGAIGGWSVLVIAFLYDRHGRGQLRLPRIAARLPRFTRRPRRVTQ